MNDVTVAPKAHLFKKGQSGNPAGRPKGSKNAISLVKLQIEGELRAQMKADMPALVSKMMEMALKGDRDMLKTIYKSWVSGTVASDEDAPREKIQIVIGKLDQIPPVNGTTYKSSKE
jgi:hypothetical protein